MIVRLLLLSFYYVIALLGTLVCAGIFGGFVIGLYITSLLYRAVIKAVGYIAEAKRRNFHLWN